MTARLVDRAPGAPAPVSEAFGDAAIGQVMTMLRRCPRYAPTPLIDATDLVRALDIRQLWIKDERVRMGGTSFKALGGSYAVLEVAAAATGTPIDRVVRERLGTGMTVTAATAGNHGWSVAAGARLIGADAVIFVYDGVPTDQVEAIERQGAKIVHATGGYDDAVAACAIEAKRCGWTLVSDSSWPGYRDVPVAVMQGYAAIADETIDQVPTLPTHLFVQAGVGGLAGAMVARLAHRAGVSAPRTIVVEPMMAACLSNSAIAERPVASAVQGRTVMGRLECYEPSIVAHEILTASGAAFLTIDDAAARHGADVLAAAGIATSASGAAGFAGLQVAAADPALRRALRLGEDSVVAIIVTEAATRDEGNPPGA